MPNIMFPMFLCLYCSIFGISHFPDENIETERLITLTVIELVKNGVRIDIQVSMTP